MASFARICQSLLIVAMISPTAWEAACADDAAPILGKWVTLSYQLAPRSRSPNTVMYALNDVIYILTRQP